MKIKLKDYETKVNELNDIIRNLESKNISLEETINLYNRGNEIYEGLYKLLNEEKLLLNINENGEWVKNEENC